MEKSFLRQSISAQFRFLEIQKQTSPRDLKLGNGARGTDKAEATRGRLGPAPRAGRPAAQGQRAPRCEKTRTGTKTQPHLTRERRNTVTQSGTRGLSTGRGTHAPRDAAARAAAASPSCSAGSGGDTRRSRHREARRGGGSELRFGSRPRRQLTPRRAGRRNPAVSAAAGPARGWGARPGSRARNRNWASPSPGISASVFVFGFLFLL